jgi:SAM-dependent methyltransferase
MLNANLRRVAEKWLPGFFLKVLDPFEVRVNLELAAFVAGLPPHLRVLDAGAGECRYAPLFQRHHYVALDSAVGDAAWDYSKLNLLGDLELLPLASASFDAAISIVTLEHAREPGRVMKETARVLRPGGKLFLVVPNQWEVHQAPHDFFRFTRYGLEHLLSQSGFKVLKIEPIGGFFWMMSRRSINLLTFFQGGWKWSLFVLMVPFLGFLFPLLCFFLDRLDKRKDFTLGYVSVAERLNGTVGTRKSADATE